MPRLYLIDGYALIYRAFYALISRPLRTSRGENTSAAWGVANFLIRLRTKYHPDYVIWINDAGDSGRTEMYPEYKSTREKLDEAMQQDFDLALTQIESLLAAFRVKKTVVSGWEADDVIGTLVTKARDQGIETVIVSGDKDFYQLIEPGVFLLNPGRGGPAGVEESWVDESNASERLGVTPRQVVDYLALVGDSSDNVPGVKGIGDKGARQLLAEYGDLDALLERAGEITQKRPREALAQYAEEARLSRRLVTIRRDAPVDLELESSIAQEPDRDKVREVLSRLEFHSLVDKLLAGEPGAVSREPGAVSAEPGNSAVISQAASPPVPRDLRLLDDAADIPELVRVIKEAGAVAVRAWATGGGPRQSTLIGLGLATAAPAAGSPLPAPVFWYLPFAHRAQDGELAAPVQPKNLPPLGAPAMALLADLFRRQDVPKVTHLAKSEWQVLRTTGIELGGLREDVLLQSFLVDPGRRSHDLDVLALDVLGRTMPSRDAVTGKGKTAQARETIDPTAVLTQLTEELALILELREKLVPGLEAVGVTGLYDAIELPLIPVLVDMEWTGIAIDPGVFRGLARDLTSDLERLRVEIANAAGTEFNFNSPKQLAAILFEKLQLPVLKKTKTGPSTDAEVLEQLATMGHEVPRLILEQRELEKLRSTYVDVLPARVNPATGRIHTTFVQAGAATGRIASTDPNLQNIPVRTARGEAIRRGFVPTAGWRFLAADYSQIELRLLAHFSGDPAFVAAFRQGDDIHRQTAAIIFGVPVAQVTPDMRGRAKTINFATIYGQGPFALSRQLGITQDEARAFIAHYFERFSGVRSWLDSQVALGREQGWVETLFHRRRYVPEIKDRNFNTRAFGERLAQNSPLQGSAADLIKIAMIRVHGALGTEGLSGRLLLQVHDELVLEAPPDEVDRVVELVRTHMEGAAELSVPLVVDIGVGDNWLDAKR
ncbi:MAG TPA: DNA polymerase I [Gemmatimonadales bacterium]|nr:DNA polymerase I [Gemmatimonadales bacterium]